MPDAYDSSSPTARSLPRILTVCLALCLLGASAGWSQLTISIAYQGPAAPTNGGPLDPGAALYVNPAPVTFPSPFWSTEQIGIFNYGIYNSREVDALSWGRNTMLRRTGPFWANGYRLFFSTDEWADGDSANSPSLSDFGVSTSDPQASADLQRTDLTPNFQIPPMGCVYDHITQIDGQGAPDPMPGFGLAENNLAAPGPDDGDTVDAVDAFMQASAMRLYFSLDAAWVDPYEGPYGNSGTAQANGYAPGDVLVSNGTWTPPAVYAPHTALGLGPEDDLDALILWENGNDVFEPTPFHFAWQSENYDMLLFSVRRGSPIIGTADSQYAFPIEEGDILSAPIFPSTVPSIFIPAECLGLDTNRWGTVSTPAYAAHGDDLDAMYVR